MSLKSNSRFCSLDMLALDAERSLFTTPRIAWLPDLLDLLELLLLLDLRDVGCCDSWLFDVAGLESGDFRREKERLIHPGDNLSTAEVGVVDITSSDIDLFVGVVRRASVEAVECNTS